MTKEWQEATEEYMKVRGFITAVAACLKTMCVLTHIIGPGNRAHHRLQGHDGPVGLGEEPAPWQQAQRRVNEWLKATRQTHNTNTNITSPWVSFPFGTVCVRCTSRSKGLHASCWISPCHISPSVYRNLRGTCDFCSTISTTILCAKRSVRIQSSPI